MPLARDTDVRARGAQASGGPLAATARRFLGVLALGLLAAPCGACAGHTFTAQTASTAAAVAPTSTAAAPAAPPDAATDISIEVRAPTRARYDASLLEAEKPFLGVVVTNRTTHAVDVSDLRLHLEATREGTAFRCARVVRAPLGVHEPAELGPGASFVFDRALDCALPLVGAYAVHVGVSFGKEDWSQPHEVRSFNLTVSALPSVAPREIDGLPGLWVSMGSSATVLGGSGGHGRTLLAIVNASHAPIEPPRMRLALRVTRLGNPIPCEDQPLVLATPSVLAPGQTHYEPIEVSCLGLSVPGSYEIAARLMVPHGSEGEREIAIGRLRVDVLTDPSFPNPGRWSATPRR